jgi:hypothetical protein
MSSDGACERARRPRGVLTIGLFQTLMVRKPRTFQGSSCAGTDHFVIGLGILLQHVLTLSYIFHFFFADVLWSGEGP